MLSGFSFGTGSRIGTATPPFDPTTLNLSGYWRANASSPWSATASAGASGGNGNLAEATNPPGPGSSVNGYTPASFDGVNDKFTSASSLDTFFNSTSLSGWVLIYNANVSGSGDIFGSPSGGTSWWGLIVSGGTVYHYVNGAAGMVTTSTLSTSAWNLITFSYNGTNIKVGINAAPSASTAYSTAITTMTATVDVGIESVSSLTYWTGDILEIAFSDTVISDANFGNVKTYCNTRYGLSL